MKFMVYKEINPKHIITHSCLHSQVIVQVIRARALFTINDPSSIPNQRTFDNSSTHLRSFSINDPSLVSLFVFA